uniref:Putative polyprotein n=1 Tax=Albugo laibachii Nc14 TaxID=890382 RepID=F0WAV1_9STRA|nr:putative polyprotein [Albugo laibachii Nc14]|eukprot:CCA18273.1 putative polyprotein [Albugo laibachii Nc14]
MRMQQSKAPLQFKSLDEKKTWIIINRPSGQKVIGCKWVFEIKRDEYGKVQRYKARLVAQGFRQKAGVDYSDTYAPVASTSSIRIFLGISVQLGYEIYQYDMDTAFLNGKLEEERSLYGLKQASAVWYKTITNVFLILKFQQCKSDACIFVRRDQTNFAYIALYVNDMLISARSFDVIESISNKLAKIFTLKKLGMAKFILVMKLSYNINNKLMYLSQKACINRMVQRFGEEKSAPIHSSAFTSQKLVKAVIGDESMKEKPFRLLIGSLLYIAMSIRPDIAFAACELSRFLEKPCVVHWNAGIRVLTVPEIALGSLINF